MLRSFRMPTLRQPVPLKVDFDLQNYLNVRQCASCVCFVLDRVCICRGTPRTHAHIHTYIHTYIHTLIDIFSRLRCRVALCCTSIALRCEWHDACEPTCSSTPPRSSSCSASVYAQQRDATQLSTIRSTLVCWRATRSAQRRQVCDGCRCCTSIAVNDIRCSLYRRRCLNRC